MTHEPECTYTPGRDGFAGTGIQFQRAYIPPQPCICLPLRAAYQRGMAEAERIARGRHIDMMYCSKPDECHTIARGAYLAAEDIRWEIDRPARIARGDGNHE